MRVDHSTTRALGLLATELPHHRRERPSHRRPGARAARSTRVVRPLAPRESHYIRSCCPRSAPRAHHHRQPSGIRGDDRRPRRLYPERHPLGHDRRSSSPKASTRSASASPVRTRREPDCPLPATGTRSATRNRGRRSGPGAWLHLAWRSASGLGRSHADRTHTRAWLGRHWRRRCNLGDRPGRCAELVGGRVSCGDQDHNEPRPKLETSPRARIHRNPQGSRTSGGRPRMEGRRSGDSCARVLRRDVQLGRVSLPCRGFSGRVRSRESDAGVDR